ncbi:hypothetical protein pb186bvf_012010 [Paramecium bursaria]
MGLNTEFIFITIIEIEDIIFSSVLFQKEILGEICNSHSLNEVIAPILDNIFYKKIQYQHLI